MRQQGARHQRAIEADGIDPVLATIIRMANDGMWFAESFNLMRYDEQLKDAVEQRLLSWTRIWKTCLRTPLIAGAMRRARKVGNRRTDGGVDDDGVRTDYFRGHASIAGPCLPALRRSPRLA